MKKEGLHPWGQRCDCQDGHSSPFQAGGMWRDDIVALGHAPGDRLRMLGVRALGRMVSRSGTEVDSGEMNGRRRRNTGVY